MTSIELTAPAKVNLFLKVLNKRKDNYHNILTVFERIALEDRIKISKIAEGIVLTSDKFITKNPKDNLVYKAARLILARAKIKGGLKIYIRKRIPIAAGLGGGSSDAAAALSGINKLYKMNLTKKELMRLAKELGADVPFFILNKPFAIGRERGDKLEVIDSKTRFWHIIIYPGFKLATKEIYEAFDRSNPSTGSGFDPELIEGSKDLTLRLRSGSSPVVRQAHHPLNHPERSRGKLLSKDLTSPGDDVKIRPSRLTLYNDLQAAAIRKKVIIGKILRRLAKLSDTGAILSGSGPSVFCLYQTRKEAITAKKKLLKRVPAVERNFWQIFIAETKGN